MTQTSIDFESLTDAEINRWAAERDNIDDPHWWCERCQSPKSAVQVTYQECCTTCGHIVVWKDSPAYAQSADAALALCERWGLKWTRHLDDEMWTEVFYPESHPLFIRGCAESDTCKFPRALTNAACAARHAKEMADAAN